MEYTRYLVMKCGSIWAKNSLPMVIDCQHIQFADYTAAQVSLIQKILINEKIRAVSIICFVK